MKKILFKKSFFFLIVIFIFAFTYFFSQKIIFNKSFSKTKQGLRVSIIKIISTTGIIDITKFTSEGSLSFFNKDWNELILSSPYFTKNKSKPDKIYLNLNSNNYKLIKENLDNSRKSNYLHSRRAYVNAKIIFNNKKIYAKVRLKGDMPDHWNHDQRFSLKINLKNQSKIYDIDEFSLQNFNTLFFPDVFIFSKMLNHHGIFTPRLKMIDLIVNGDHWGPMVMKEYYSSDFFENRNEREFPLFKYYDDTRTHQLINRINFKHKILDQKILKGILNTGDNFFSVGNKKKNKDLNIRSLYNSYLELINLRDPNRFKIINSFSNIDHIMKIASFGLLFGGDSHAYYPDNLRIYYNFYLEQFFLIPTEPNIIEKLTEKNYSEFNKFLIFNFDNQKKKEYLEKMLKFIVNFENNFNDRFIKIYSKNVCINSLKKCEFKIKKIFNTIKSNIKISKQLLKKEIIYIANLSNKSKSNMIVDKSNMIVDKSNMIVDKLNLLNIEDNFKKANSQNNIFDNINDHFYLRIFNESLQLKYYFEPTLIIDSIYNLTKKKNIKKRIFINNEDNLIKLNFLNDFDPGDEIELTYKFNNKTFKKNYFVEDKKFMLDNLSFIKYAPTLSAMLDRNNFNYSFIVENNKNFIIKKGIWNINDSLFFKDKNLIIEPGTTLNFSKNSSLTLINGDLISLGTQKENIIFKNLEEEHWGGIKIINSNNTYIKYAKFMNVSNFVNSISNLTGSLNFYKSNVVIENSFFNNSIAEDFINFVSSNFRFVNSKITNTVSDGIDSDFSNGIINDSTFSYIKGDAVDTSFSKLTANNNNLKNISDKAFSIGERSSVDINNNKIEKAKIGIAVKDSSKLTGNLNSIKNSLFADITSYNKKKKFSHSTTNIKLKEKYSNLILKNTSNNILIVNDIFVKNKYDNMFLNNSIYGF
mgnify:FL=1